MITEIGMPYLPDEDGMCHIVYSLINPAIETDNSFFKLGPNLLWLKQPMDQQESDRPTAQCPRKLLQLQSPPSPGEITIVTP